MFNKYLYIFINYDTWIFRQRPGKNSAYSNSLLPITSSVPVTTRSRLHMKSQYSAFDYTGNLVLENGTRSRLLYDGGYVSISNSGAAEEYNHYYPLGGPIAQYSSTSIQPIKFQSKEWSGEKGLTLYDFGARRPDVLALVAHRQAVVFLRS